MPISCLYGKVIDSITGEGLANATVTLLGAGGYSNPVTTFPNGYYIMDGLLPGEDFGVRYEKAGYHSLYF